MSGLSREELCRLAAGVERRLGVHIELDEEGAEDRLAETIAGISDERSLEQLLSDIGSPQDASNPQDAWVIPGFKAKPGRRFVRRGTEELPFDPPTFADSAVEIGRSLAPGTVGVIEGVNSTGKSTSLAKFLTSLKEKREDFPAERMRVLLVSLERTRLDLDEAAVRLRNEVNASFYSRVRSAFSVLGHGSRWDEDFNRVEIRVSENSRSHKPSFEVVLGDFQMTIESADKALDITKQHFDSPSKRVSILEAARTKLSEATYQIMTNAAAGNENQDFFPAAKNVNRLAQVPVEAASDAANIVRMVHTDARHEILADQPIATQAARYTETGRDISTARPLRTAADQMTRHVLIDAVSKSADISKADAGRALDGVVAAIRESLRNGRMVTLVGLGTFYVGKRAARTGRNPRTKATIKIKSTKVLKFRPGRDLKDAGN